MGRPTKYSKELVSNICVKIANGKSLREICKEKTMPALSSIFLWLSEYTEFSDQYARAKEEQSELFADEIVEIADNEPDPQRARVKIDARKWVASKLKPKKYGDKIENVISNKDGETFKTSNMSDKELNAKLAELTALNKKK